MLNLQPGDIVQVKDWQGEVFRVKVRDTFESKQFGRSFTGWQVDEDLTKAHRKITCWRFVSLPEQFVQIPARLSRFGRGKWDIELPSGETERLPSRKAALVRIAELGLTPSEE